MHFSCVKENTLSHQSSLFCVCLCDLTLGPLYCSTLFRLIQLYWDREKAKCQCSKAWMYLTLHLISVSKNKLWKIESLHVSCVFNRIIPYSGTFFSVTYKVNNKSGDLVSILSTSISGIRKPTSTLYLTFLNVSH